MPLARLALVGLLLAQSGWQADPRVVRETAAKQPAFNFEESKVPSYTLPKLLPIGGKTVRTPEAWSPVSNTDPTRREQSDFWPAEQVIARGYGIAAIQTNDLAPDDKERFRDGVIRLSESGATAGPAPTWAALAAWAWGASRAMDYFATDSRVDATHVAIVGHSRGGKAALWAGAEDERFFLVVSNESG